MDTALYWSRWIVALPLGAIFLLCAIGNWQLLIGGMIRAIKTGKSLSGSMILPFIGPVLGIGFFLLIPVAPMNSLFWLAPIIEPTWMVGLYCLLTGPFAKRMKADRNN
ncbi:hypothetical protein [Sulfuriroseicoccus oceanibius]|uniref:Uncharacterized protein n=1 Tax=Sulfuriroseicoccus oceanibius TaxID=2707525 RepID=A0A6B3LEJ6_9BACT|nr:hypothetical protein [Sulfuriroseicoccus oceanibius]QQL44595.1 hypothetical protein G3M56_011990 [Sulfuriroseicoccus oceanibius]